MHLFLVPLLGASIYHLIILAVGNSTGAPEVDNLLLQLEADNSSVLLLCSAAAAAAAATAAAVVVYYYYFASTATLAGRRPVYLLDFACYKPPDALKCSHERFIELSRLTGCFSDETLRLQEKILRKSGLGQCTYAPGAFLTVPPSPCVAGGREELMMLTSGVVDEVLGKTGVRAEDIGILVVNNALFNPAPSISAMIVNRYKLRKGLICYNIGGMGCSAGIIAVDLAKDLLQVHPNQYALLVSSDTGPFNWYNGNNRSMLVANCLFRVGATAALLTNHRSDRRRAKYQLTHTVRTHRGADDDSHGCVRLEEDETGRLGIALSKDLMAVAGEALKSNITALGPLVLPTVEKLLYLATSVCAGLLKTTTSTKRVAIRAPDFKKAFDHFCIHVGGKAVLDAMEKNLKLDEWRMEPSRMTLYRFGNVSSSSVWYELAYCEAKGRIKKGDRVWQIGFGSGFKCASSVWRALRTVDLTGEKNVWTDEIDGFPVQMQ